jgi:hypothetical protein
MALSTTRIAPKQKTPTTQSPRQQVGPENKKRCRRQTPKHTKCNEFLPACSRDRHWTETKKKQRGWRKKSNMTSSASKAVVILSDPNQTVKMTKHKRSPTRPWSGVSWRKYKAAPGLMEYHKYNWWHKRQDAKTYSLFLTRVSHLKAATTKKPKSGWSFEEPQWILVRLATLLFRIPCRVVVCPRSTSNNVSSYQH